MLWIQSSAARSQGGAAKIVQQGTSSAFGDSAMGAVWRDFVGILDYRALVKAERNIEIAIVKIVQNPRWWPDSELRLTTHVRGK